MSKETTKKAAGPRRNLGNLGERLAQNRLVELGYQIIATNWRCSIGELDIVAWHEQCLTFIEVRTRRSIVAGTPEESVTPVKQQRLLQLVEIFLQTEPNLLDKQGNLPPCRIDLVAVEFEPNGKLRRLEIIQNAVQSD